MIVVGSLVLPVWCLWAATLLIRLCIDPRLWACALGQPDVDLGVHPPEVSSVGAHFVFQVWVPKLLIEVRAHVGALGLSTQAVEC